MAPSILAVRAASFVLTSALVWLAYPVLAVLVYVGLLIASAVGDLDMGGPLAGPLLVLLGVVAGVVCVAIAMPVALAARAVGGTRGALAGTATLFVLVTGATGLASALADPPANLILMGAVLLAATAPAAVALAFSDVAVGLLVRFAPADAV